LEKKGADSDELSLKAVFWLNFQLNFRRKHGESPIDELNEIL